MAKDKDLAKRKLPPSFPLGLRAGVSKDVIIIDLIDPDVDGEVFYSFSLSKTTAKQLNGYLENFLNQEDTNESES